MTFLWKELSELDITLDIQGAWKPSFKNPRDEFLMERFIDRRYNKAVLEVLNDIRVYMKVITLRDISKGGQKMTKWAMSAKVNRNFQWSWPARRHPTPQNMKVWRNCLRGTFMKGIDDLLHPVTSCPQNSYGQLAFPTF